MKKLRFNKLKGFIATALAVLTFVFGFATPGFAADLSHYAEPREVDDSICCTRIWVGFHYVFGHNNNTPQAYTTEIDYFFKELAYLLTDYECIYLYKADKHADVVYVENTQEINDRMYEFAHANHTSWSPIPLYVGWTNWPNENTDENGHIWDSGSIIEEATCTTEGKIRYTCSLCYNYKTEPIPKKDHSWDNGTVTKAATCTDDGEKTYTCSTCGQTKTETITKLRHADAWTTTKPATCSTAGVRTRKCTRSGCGFTETQTISALGHSFTSWNTTIKATCTTEGKQERSCTRSGCNYSESQTIPKKDHSWDNGTVTKAATYSSKGIKAYICSVCKATKTEEIAKLGTQIMYRLYNPYSGEHLYTSDTKERNTLVGLGWKYEGLAWTAPSKSNTPVYRLYNKYSGDHHYTTNKNEYDACVKQGWNGEGIGFYSDDAKGVTVYRLYNKYLTAGTHHYTTSKNEYDKLGKIGWSQENIGWYGVAE